jgi:hypothetical protein
MRRQVAAGKPFELGDWVTRGIAALKKSPS